MIFPEGSIYSLFKDSGSKDGTRHGLWSQNPEIGSQVVHGPCGFGTVRRYLQDNVANLDDALSNWESGCFDMTRLCQGPLHRSDERPNTGRA